MLVLYYSSKKLYQVHTSWFDVKNNMPWCCVAASCNRSYGVPACSFCSTHSLWQTKRFVVHSKKKSAAPSIDTKIPPASDDMHPQHSAMLPPHPLTRQNVLSRFVAILPNNRNVPLPFDRLYCRTYHSWFGGRGSPLESAEISFFEFFKVIDHDSRVGIGFHCFPSTSVSKVTHDKNHAYVWWQKAVVSKHGESLRVDRELWRMTKLNEPEDKNDLHGRSVPVVHTRMININDQSCLPIDGGKTDCRR